MPRLPRLVRSLAPLAALAAFSGSSALAATRTYTIDFFPELPVQGTLTSLTFDPRLAEPFLAGAQIIETRLVIGFTATGGFDAADLNFSVVGPMNGGSGWFVNGGVDLGWAGPGPHTATLTTHDLDGTIPQVGRAIWFWDIAGDFDQDPPAYSGSFTAVSRVEFDYIPLPAAAVAQDAVVCTGQPASFTARTSCDGPATYQWECLGGPAQDWTPLVNGPNSVGGQFLVTAAGATGVTLTVTPGAGGWSVDQPMEFRCTVATAECGGVTSPGATLETSGGVAATPYLMEFEPLCYGSAAHLSVSPGGVAPFTFQWRKGGVPISAAANPSAVTDTLEIASLKAGDVGVYDCVLTDACGSGLSDPYTFDFCRADFNCEGGVELLDIFAFLNAWFGGDAKADFNGQNGVDLLDIFGFLSAWFAGPCV